MNHADRIPIIKAGLVDKVCNFHKLSKKAEQESCRTVWCLFETHAINSDHSVMRHSLHCNTANIIGRNNENAGEWRLWIRAAECKYMKLDRYLKEQFIKVLKDNTMLGEITQEQIFSSDMSIVTSEQDLVWARRVWAQIAQEQCSIF